MNEDKIVLTTDPMQFVKHLNVFHKNNNSLLYYTVI